MNNGTFVDLSVNQVLFLTRGNRQLIFRFVFSPPVSISALTTCEIELDYTLKSHIMIFILQRFIVTFRV